MFFSTLIFVIAFLPLFTMRGVEGAIFSPMSHTYAFALGIAILLAVTLSPVLSSYFFARGMRAIHNPIWTAIAAFYHGMFERVLRWPRTDAWPMVVLLVVGVLSLFPLLGGAVPAQARGRKHLGARDDAADDFARAWRQAVQPDALSASRAFPRSTRSSRSSAVPTTAPRPRGFFNIEFAVDLKAGRSMAGRYDQDRNWSSRSTTN